MTALAPLAPAGTGTEQPEPTPPAGGARSRLGILVVPALLMFLAFAFVPLIGVLVLSFTDWDGIGAIQFVGGQSWSQVLTDHCDLRDRLAVHPVSYAALPRWRTADPRAR